MAKHTRRLSQAPAPLPCHSCTGGWAKCTMTAFCTCARKPQNRTSENAFIVCRSKNAVQKKFSTRYEKGRNTWSMAYIKHTKNIRAWHKWLGRGRNRLFSCYTLVEGAVVSKPRSKINLDFACRSSRDKHCNSAICRVRFFNVTKRKINTVPFKYRSRQNGFQLCIFNSYSSKSLGKHLMKFYLCWVTYF